MKIAKFLLCQILLAAFAFNGHVYSQLSSEPSTVFCDLAIDFGSSLGVFTYNAQGRVIAANNFLEWENKKVAAHVAFKNPKPLPKFLKCKESWSLGQDTLPKFTPKQSPAHHVHMNAQSRGYTQISASDALRIAWADLDGDKSPELVASYAGEGIRIHYRNGSETLLHSIVPEYFDAVDLDGDDKEELVLTFSQYGLYIYDGSWTKIHSLTPSYFAAVDLNGDGKEELALNFSELGFYTYEDGDLWIRHHSVLPIYFRRIDVDGDGNEQLAVSFQEFGLYFYDGSTWALVHSYIPEHYCRVDMDGNGKDELAVSFATPTLSGLYIYTQDEEWLHLHSFLPTTFVNCDVNNNGKQELAVVLDGNGLYTYEDGVGWQQLHTQQAENLASWDSTSLDPFQLCQNYQAYNAENTDNIDTRGYYGATSDGVYVYYVPCRASAFFHGHFLRYNTTKDFDDTSAWEAHEQETTSTHPTQDTPTLPTMGYADAVYDTSRYIYYVPYIMSSGRHSHVLRYDTQGNFTANSSWKTFNARKVPGMPASGDLGYDGGVYVDNGSKKHIYFAPYGDQNASQPYAICYDTEESFFQTSSWKVYDVRNTNGLTNKGYYDITIDGRYVYYAPYADGTGTSFHGQVLRYDSEQEFDNSASWEVYDAGNTDNLPTVGFKGAVFDGRYVYFVPYRKELNEANPDESGQHTNVLRFDTKGSLGGHASNFQNPANWSAYDASNIDGNYTVGYVGAECDGNYIYFIPYEQDSIYHGNILRYDITSGFKEASSWSSFDLKTIGPVDGIDTVGYKYGTIVHNYLYLAPYGRESATSPFHGVAMRYQLADRAMLDEEIVYSGHTFQGLRAEDPDKVSPMLASDDNIKIVKPRYKNFQADGFFELQPLVTYEQDYQYAVVDVSKVDVNGDVETYETDLNGLLQATTRIYEKKATYLANLHIKQRIWFKFGPGNYKIEIYKGRIVLGNTINTPYDGEVDETVAQKTLKLQKKRGSLEKKLAKQGKMP